MFPNFQVKAAHQATSVGEAKYEKHGGPLGPAQLSCKTGISGLHTLANVSLPVKAETAVEFSTTTGPS